MSTSKKKTNSSSWDSSAKRIKKENLSSTDVSEDESKDQSWKDEDSKNELNNLILEISWESRDKFLNHSNRFTGLLYLKSDFSDGLIDKIKEENRNLINELMELNVIRNNDGKLFQTKKLKTESKLNVQNGEKPFDLSNLPKLEIDWSFRKKLIDNLAMNQHAILIDEIGKQTKKALIDQNLEIVDRLMKLKVILNEEEDDEEESDEEIQTNSKNFSQREEQQKANDVDKKLEILKEELTQQIDKIEQKLNSRLDTKEIRFTFKVSNAKKFLQFKESRHVSEIFYLQNIPFYIVVQNRMIFDSVTGNTGYLDVYVHCDHVNSTTRWSLGVKVFVKFLSSLCDVKEVTTKFDFVYNRKSSVGIPNMVSHQEMNNPKKQYIKNDSFFIQVNMFSDKLVLA